MISDGEAIQSRLRNRQAALAFIRRTGGCSRSDLMRELGLSRSGVNHLVSALLEEGIIESSSDGQGSRGRRGRPSTYLQYNGSRGYVAGVDLGHGHVTVALADLNGNIHAEATERFDVDHDPVGTVKLARTLLDGLLEQAENPVVQHIVAGIPGPLDARTGKMRTPTVLAGWRDVQTFELFQDSFEVPVTLEHDAFLGVYGEFTRGAGRGCDNLLYVKVSGGVGAAMVLGGRGYRGTSGLAGEIGHTAIPGTSELCRCGNRGCVESVVSMDTLRRQLGFAAGKTYEADEFDVREITDVAGVRILSEAGWTLGRLLAESCNCLNPQRLILGGALGAYSQTFLEGVESAVTRFAQPAISEDVTVCVSELGTRSEIVGAVMLAAERAVQAASTGSELVNA